MLQVNELIGFGVGGGLTINFFASSSNENAPLGLILGDVIIVLLVDSNYPPGYQGIGGVGTAINASYKISDGTESGLDTGGTIVAVFRGSSPINAVTVRDFDSQQTGGDPSPQTITSASGSAPLIAFGGYFAGGGVVSPRTMTPAKDGEVSDGATSLYLAWKIYNEAQQDVVVDMDDESAVLNQLISFYLEFS